MPTEPEAKETWERKIVNNLQCIHFFFEGYGSGLVSVAARSKACGRSPAEIVGPNPTGGMDVCVVSVVFCLVEVTATSRSFLQRSPTDCGVSLCMI